MAVADILKELISFKQIGLPGEGDRNREWIFTGCIDSHCYHPRANIYCAMDLTRVIIPSISSGMTLTRNVQKHERSSKISGGKAIQCSDTEWFLTHGRVVFIFVSDLECNPRVSDQPNKLKVYVHSMNLSVTILSFLYIIYRLQFFTLIYFSI